MEDFGAFLLGFIGGIIIMAICVVPKIPDAETWNYVGVCSQNCEDEKATDMRKCITSCAEALEKVPTLRKTMIAKHAEKAKAMCERPE